MNNWAGALVCPDEANTYYAVGIFHSEKGNCDFGNERAPDVFDTLVSQAARDGK